MESASLVTAAFELGVTLFDTAERYGTEELVGLGISQLPRDEVTISTKAAVRVDDSLRPGGALRDALHQSLRSLGTEWIDIYHLHGVWPHDYDYVVQEFLPILDSEREKGTIRAIGITERFSDDPSHSMMVRAARDPYWDVSMIGFNVLNQSARRLLFSNLAANSTGVLAMFVVRRSLSGATALSDAIDELVSSGHLSDDVPVDRVAWLLEGSGATSLTELAYRYARHEPGVDVALFGTGDRKHLEENIAALQKPPLPFNALNRLGRLFGTVDHISGQ